MSYDLVDCREMAKKHPETFEVPSVDELTKIEVGDFVKLIFEEDDKTSERMWVEVVSNDFPAFTGELNNDPFNISSISLGSFLEFESRHIASVIKGNDVDLSESNYLFIREFEGDVLKKSSTDLEDFKEFCHYSSLSDWETHKKYIEKCLDNTGAYALTGNDVKYYIVYKD